MVLLGALAGCTSGAAPDSITSARAEATAAPAVSGAASTAKAVVLGGPRSACPLPVSFELAASWFPEAVHVGLAQGSVQLVCEIDAKPAGHLGFLRVWTGTDADEDPHQALEAFVAGHSDTESVTYTATRTGGFAAAEAAYTMHVASTDVSKRERALALKTPRGVVLLHLAGLDSQEHEAMLPAFEQAKRTIRGS
ncbi:lipoprotein [Streptomyces sp. NPDC006879]|uniref:lipoprotein n=1 Tax=Streptomyces sp. NPDC006879 TaxID=3364767 RepID=UPI0036B14D6D